MTTEKINNNEKDVKTWQLNDEGGSKHKAIDLCLEKREKDRARAKP